MIPLFSQLMIRTCVCKAADGISGCMSSTSMRCVWISESIMCALACYTGVIIASEIFHEAMPRSAPTTAQTELDSKRNFIYYIFYKISNYLVRRVDVTRELPPQTRCRGRSAPGGH